MKTLQKYCTDELIIDGMKTYIVSPKHYESILFDAELAKQLGIPDALKDNIIPKLIENTNRIHELKIHFAFVWHEKRKNCIWEPINVCEYNGRFFHVYIRDSWLCMECGHIHAGNIIMPMFEADIVFSDHRIFNVPDIFKKVPCENCGRLLQDHLLIVK